MYTLPYNEIHALHWDNYKIYPNFCVSFTCIFHFVLWMNNSANTLSPFWMHIISVHHFNHSFLSPAQLTNDGLGCLAQVRRILEHPIQNLGINLLRLRTWKGGAENMKRDFKTLKRGLETNQSISCCLIIWTCECLNWIMKKDTAVFHHCRCHISMLPSTG